MRPFAMDTIVLILVPKGLLRILYWQIVQFVILN